MRRRRPPAAGSSSRRGRRSPPWRSTRCRRWAAFQSLKERLPSLSFQAKEFTIPAGVIQVNYVDQAAGASHTLVFSESQFSGFQLAVPQGPKTGKVDLKPGTYTIYCTIPGHRAAGMQATVTAG